MKKTILFLFGSFIAFCCTAQETKPPKQTIVNDTSTVLVPLRGVKSTGVRGCSNCNVAGRLASSLGVTSFTLNSLSDFKYNEKQNTLEVKYLISNVVGKISTGVTTVSGPYGNKNPHAGQSPCTGYGFGCPPPAYRIGKTKYQIKTEGNKSFLVMTFLEDLKVEKGFFSE